MWQANARLCTSPEEVVSRYVFWSCPMHNTYRRELPYFRHPRLFWRTYLWTQGPHLERIPVGPSQALGRRNKPGSLESMGGIPW